MSFLLMIKTKIFICRPLPKIKFQMLGFLIAGHISHDLRMKFRVILELVWPSDQIASGNGNT